MIDCPNISNSIKFYSEKLVFFSFNYQIKQSLEQSKTFKTSKSYSLPRWQFGVDIFAMKILYIFSRSAFFNLTENLHRQNFHRVGVGCGRRKSRLSYFLFFLFEKLFTGNYLYTKTYLFSRFRFRVLQNLAFLIYTICLPP